MLSKAVVKKTVKRDTKLVNKIRIVESPARNDGDDFVPMFMNVGVLLFPRGRGGGEVLYPGSI